MNFIVKEYDPLDEALERFQQLNSDPAASEFSETEIAQLAVQAVKRHG